MARNPNNLPADESSAGAEDNVVPGRVQELTWALLDECATEEDVELLDNLLLSDASARQSYIECIQLHTDMMAHFAKPTALETPNGKSPVLGFLNPDTSLGLQSPAAEDSTR